MSDESLPAAPEGFEKIQVSFLALALDILSGVAIREGALREDHVSFAVWVDPDHPLCTLILRFFEGRTGVALAAYMPENLVAPEFEQQVNALEDALRRPAGGEPLLLREVVTRLRPLNLTESCTHLGTVLGARAITGGETYESGLLGQATEDMLDRLSALEEVAQSHVWDDAQGEDLFGIIAEDYLDNPRLYRWTKDKEVQNLARVEVLEHSKIEGAAALLAYKEGMKNPDVSLYVPEYLQDPDTLSFDFHAMLVDRKIGSDDRLPLAKSAVFQPIAPAKIKGVLNSILAQIGQGKGYEYAMTAEELEEGYRDAIKTVFDEVPPPAVEGIPSDSPHKWH